MSRSGTAGHLVDYHPATAIVTLLCDSGARYTTTYDDDTWLTEQGIDISPYLPVVERAWDDRVWDFA